jgi:transcriptional regulator with XRE-family HTH domain
MRSQVARKQLSATNARNLRTLLLLNVFEPEEIGARIQQAREKAGLRQEDLADLIGMSTRQVQNYEAGESKPFAKLRAIAAATSTTVEWLLHGDEVKEASDAEVVARLGKVEEQLQEILRRLPASQDASEETG